MTQRWSPYSRFSVSVNFKTILSISSMIFKRKIWLSCVVKYDEAFELPVHLHRHSILIKYYIHLHGSTQLSMSATSFNQTHKKSYHVNKWFNKIKISVDTLQIPPILPIDPINLFLIPLWHIQSVLIFFYWHFTP